MNRIYLLAMSLLLLMSCGNRRPGMSREDAAAELKEQAAQEEAVRKERAASIDTFAADYRPPVGIKYQAKIVTAGAKTIDVAAALKNVRKLKPNELGTPVLYATGVEAVYPDPLLKVGDEWLLNGVQGLFLLDNNFRLVKQLFRSNVELRETSLGTAARIHDMIDGVGYDASLRQLRACVRQKSRYVASIPWDDLRAITEAWTFDDLASLLPMKKIASFAVMEGGFLTVEPFSSRVYTFGLKGDTLCRFVVNDAEDYMPTSTYRNAEVRDVYQYGGRPRLRMAYDNTIYELKDASTLKAVWRLDFGTLKRPTGKYVVEKVSNSLEGYWLLNDIIETSRYIFIWLAEGHDCPANRKAGKVKLYTILYDKQTGECFSLPPAKDEKGVSDYPALPFEYEGKTFFGQPFGDADGRFYLFYEGRQLKKQLPGVPAVEALKDKEAAFMMIK